MRKRTKHNDDRTGCYIRPQAHNPMPKTERMRIEETIKNIKSNKSNASE
jgi:hypothetical protein